VQTNPQTNRTAALGDRPVVQRDDGKWSLGWHDDAAGPFDSRADAIRVASGYRPAPVPAGKFHRTRIRGVSSHAPA
jgi:hypothetical protein